MTTLEARKPSVFLRPLRITDAEVSYRWRNNSEIWRFTASKPSQRITPSIERDWLEGALTDDSSARYAICLNPSREYVGNVQFTDIEGNTAQFHIFIGEQKYWGLGIGTLATAAALRLAKDELKLAKIWLRVSEQNVAAVRIYSALGFERTDGSTMYLTF